MKEWSDRSLISMGDVTSARQATARSHSSPGLDDLIKENVVLYVMMMLMCDRGVSINNSGAMKQNQIGQKGGARFRDTVNNTVIIQMSTKMQRFEH